MRLSMSGVWHDWLWWSWVTLKPASNASLSPFSSKSSPSQFQADSRVTLLCFQSQFGILKCRNGRRDYKRKSNKEKRDAEEEEMKEKLCNLGLVRRRRKGLDRCLALPLFFLLFISFRAVLHPLSHFLFLLSFPPPSLSRSLFITVIPALVPPLPVPLFPVTHAPLPLFIVLFPLLPFTPLLPPSLPLVSCIPHSPRPFLSFTTFLPFLLQFLSTSCASSSSSSFTLCRSSSF